MVTKYYIRIIYVAITKYPRLVLKCFNFNVFINLAILETVSPKSMGPTLRSPLST